MIGTGSYTATLTNSGVQEICRFQVDGQTRLGVEIAVTTNALAAFEIHGRMHRDGAFWKIASASGDFTTAVGVLVGTSGDLTGQAVGSGFFVMDVAAFETVLLKGTSGNISGSHVTVNTRAA